MNNFYHVFGEKNMQPTPGMRAHSFDAAMTAIDLAASSQRLGLLNRRKSRLPLSAGPRSYMMEKIEAELMLARLQSHTPPKRMSLLQLSTPPRPSSSLESLVARKRSVELALERDLLAEEILIQAAKRRRLQREDQFVQSKKLLPDPQGFLLPPPSTKEEIKASSILSSPPSTATSIPSSDSFPSFYVPSSYHASKSPIYCEPTPTATQAPVLLCLSCDEDNLTDYQQLARKQIQLFQAQHRDVESSTKGRNRSVSLGQVGIQCRHCAHLPPGQRARGSTIYPSKLEGVYQASQNMANSHLAKYCQHIPENIRSQLIKLGNRKSSAGGGKDYWTNGAKILGVVEGEHGLSFAKAR